MKLIMSKSGPSYPTVLFLVFRSRFSEIVYTNVGLKLFGRVVAVLRGRSVVVSI